MLKKTLFILCAFCIFSLVVSAQDFSRVDLFGGFSLRRAEMNPADIRSVDSNNFDGVIKAGYMIKNESRVLNGWSAGAQYNFNKRMGLAVDTGWHTATLDLSPYLKIGPLNCVPDNCLTLLIQNQTAGTLKRTNLTILIGPRISQPVGKRLSVIGHVMAGVDRTAYYQYRGVFDWKLSVSTIAGPTTRSFEGIVNGVTSPKIGFLLDLGGGLDYKINHRVSIRALQADYLRSRNTFGLRYDFLQKTTTSYANPNLPTQVTEITDRKTVNGPTRILNDLRLSFGVVVHLGKQ